MKKIFSILILLILIKQSSLSQEPGIIDSLLNELKIFNSQKLELRNNSNSLYDTTAANILHQLSKTYLNNKPDSAIWYSNRSLQLSKTIGYKRGMAKAYNLLGAIENGKGNYIKALEWYKLNLGLRNELGDKKGRASAYNNIGVIYNDLGNYSEALKNYQASLTILEAANDKSTSASCYNNIGIIYDVIGNYPKALENYSFSLKIRTEINDKKGIAASNINIGVVKKTLGNYAEALENYLIALKTYKEIGDKKGIADSYNNLGNIFYRLGNYNEALKNYFTSLEINAEIDDQIGIIESTNNIGIAYIKQNKFKESAVYLNKSLALSQQMGSIALIRDNYLGLSELESAQAAQNQRSYPQRIESAMLALDYYKRTITYRDSLVNQETSKKIAQQEMQFAFGKKEQEISLLKSQQEIERLNANRRRGINFGLGGALLGMISVAFAFYLQNKKTKKINANLETAYKKLESTQEQLIKSEKMAAFGVMATRVSHEILNPLNFVNNFSELSQEIVTDILTSSNEEDKKQNADLLIANLQKINEQGKKAAVIVTQLQEHTNKGTAHDYFEAN